MIDDYRLVHSSNPGGLVGEVNKQMEKGFVPVGGVYGAMLPGRLQGQVEFVIFQAMVRKEGSEAVIVGKEFLS